MDRTFIWPVFFCLFLGFFIASNIHIKNERNKLSAQYALNIVNAPPEVVQLIAGEFKGLMADFILMQVSSFTGSGKDISQEEWKNVLLGFEQVMGLDPYFEQTYLLAQSAMAWDAKMPEEGNRLLDIARHSRPWDFRPGFYMGFNYYYFLNDYDRASNIFIETAKVENAPVLIALLGSRFSAKDGRTQASLLVLENMLDAPDISENSLKEIKHRIMALKGVMILENAVKVYADRFGAKPESLDKLIDTGVISQLPPNPYLTSYTYDPVNNEVRFDKVKDLGK
jgi:hypothetical protein